MRIETIPLLKDNYAYLLIDNSGTIAVVDPSEAKGVISILEKNNFGLDYIINTHHHWDHTGGNALLKKKYGAKIIAPAADAHRIDDMDQGLKEGDIFSLGESSAHIFETPGHTSGHICLWFKEDKALFTGDTLFSMGCGRLFEGTAEQMWDSFQKICALPDDTMIYCGHEYTLANGAFGHTIEPDNEALIKRIKEAKQLRAENTPTIPVTLETEKQTNVFLRAGNAARFAEIRSLKDNA